MACRKEHAVSWIAQPDTTRQLIIPVDAHMIGQSTVLILGDLVFPLRPIVFRAALVIAKAVPSDEASECRGRRKRGETYDVVKRHF